MDRLRNDVVIVRFHSVLLKRSEPV